MNMVQFNICFNKRSTCLYRKEILDELDKTNYPKTELAVQEETGRTFELKLNHDEVKYICFKPS